MRNKYFFTVIIIMINTVFYGSPFFGGFLVNNEVFDKDSFSTINSLSFYLDNAFNDNARFYTRLTGSFRYRKDFVSTDSGLYDFTFIPSIDLAYFEFKTIGGSTEGEIGSDFNKGLFLFRFGRIPVIAGNNTLLDIKGEGLDFRFTAGQFSMRAYGVTNSLDYVRFFDFIGDGNLLVFTNWDNKRVPRLDNHLIPGNTNGFISDVTSSDFNLYFSDPKNDYTTIEMERLNNLRLVSVMAGRVFTGLNISVSEIYNQNISFDFLANIDLIPEEFVITYPNELASVQNTFGGRYNSFYISLNVNGKIIDKLYYDIQGVYQTGVNTTYFDDGISIKSYDALINSFALYHTVSYLFSHITKPTLSFGFYYAHGDEDVDYNKNAVINTAGDDNSFRSPSGIHLGYVIQPFFSNLFAFSLSHTIKPFASLGNDFLNELGIELTGILFFRPVITGETFIPEKAYYIHGQPGYLADEKYFIGGEIDININWRLFSDLLVRVNSGFFIPNYMIYNSDDFLFKVGISAVLLF